MTRSIVLRFDATCIDCGRSLSAGSTARWFGKGRVSCCGTGAPDQTGPFGARAPLQPVTTVTPTPTAPAPHVPLSPWIDAASLKPLDELARDTGIPIESLASGLSPAHVETLARVRPHQRLLVRLTSGARFIVPAEHARHVIRCLEESLIDRVRDVALLADSTTATR